MTKKDYVLIAEAINSFHFPDQRMGREAELEMMAFHFVNYLIDTNPQFDKARFIHAAVHNIYSKTKGKQRKSQLVTN